MALGIEQKNLGIRFVARGQFGIWDSARQIRHEKHAATKFARGETVMVYLHYRLIDRTIWYSKTQTFNCTNIPQKDQAKYERRPQDTKRTATSSDQGCTASSAAARRLAAQLAAQQSAVLEITRLLRRKRVCRCVCNGQRHPPHALFVLPRPNEV